VIPSEKKSISEKFEDSRTAHLRPLIDFLKAQGNPPWPAPGYGSIGADGFVFDRDGYGTFYFRDPLVLDAVRQHFLLSTTILAQNGAIWDQRNGVGITLVQPVEEALDFDL
jgi:hypothetical protein